MGALRIKASRLEAPLDSTMSLESPQARKNPLSSHETTVPVKPDRFGEQNPPLKRRGLKKIPRLKETTKSRPLGLSTSD